MLAVPFFLLTAACSKHDPSPASATSSTPSASSASAPSPSTPPPPVTRVFHEILRAPGPIAFSPLGAVSMVRAGDLAFRIEGGKMVQHPDDASLSRARSYGTWPNDIVAEVLIERAEMDPHVGAGRLDGKALKTLVTPGESESAAFLVRAKDDQWLAAVVNGKSDWRWQTLPSKATTTPSPGSRPKDETPCKNAFLPDEGFGGGDGVFVAAGFPCAAQKTARAPYVARWSGGTSEPTTLQALDGVKTTTGAMLVTGRSGHPTYVAHETEAFLVAWNGQAFAPVAVPGPVNALSLAPDGTLYLVTGGVLHARAVDGNFAPIRTSFPADKVWTDDEGKLFVSALRMDDGRDDEKDDHAPKTGENLKARALFTDAFAVPQLVHAPSSAAVETGREDGLELGTEACGSLYVRVLSGARKGQKFPTLPGLVKEVGDVGATRLVLDETSKRNLALAAIVPDVATGKKLAAAIAVKAGGPKAKGPKPRVACRVPVDRGAVTVDPG